MKRLITLLLVLAAVPLAPAASVHFAVTNSDGSMCTNALIVTPIWRNINADGSWSINGVSKRLLLTNGTNNINLMRGAYAVTNPVSGWYQLFTIPTDSGSYNAFDPGIVISGGNVFNYVGGMSASSVTSYVAGAVSDAIAADTSKPTLAQSTNIAAYQALIATQALAQAIGSVPNGALTNGSNPVSIGGVGMTNGVAVFPGNVTAPAFIGNLAGEADSVDNLSPGLTNWVLAQVSGATGTTNGTTPGAVTNIVTLMAPSLTVATASTATTATNVAGQIPDARLSAALQKLATNNAGDLTNFNGEMLNYSSNSTGFNFTHDDRIGEYPVATLRPTQVGMSLVQDIMPNGAPTNSAGSAAWLDLVDRDLYGKTGTNAETWRVVRMGIYTNGNAVVGTTGWGSTTPGTLSLLMGAGAYFSFVGAGGSDGGNAWIMQPGKNWNFSDLLFYNDNVNTLGDATHRPSKIFAGTNGIQSWGTVTATAFAGTNSVGTAGQVLTSDGTNSYWATFSGGSATNAVALQAGNATNLTVYGSVGDAVALRVKNSDAGYILDFAGQVLRLWDGSTNNTAWINGTLGSASFNSSVTGSKFIAGTNIVAVDGSIINGVGFTNGSVYGDASHMSGISGGTLTNYNITVSNALVAASVTGMQFLGANANQMTLATNGSIVTPSIKSGVRLTNVLADVLSSATNYVDRIESTNSSELVIFGGGITLTLGSGTLRADSGGFAGPGNNLTNLNASELASGLVPSARVPYLAAKTNAALYGQPTLPDFHVGTAVSDTGAFIGIDSSGYMVQSATYGWGATGLGYIGAVSGNASGLTNFYGTGFAFTSPTPTTATNFVVNFAAGVYKTITATNNVCFVYTTNGPGVASFKIYPNGADRTISIPTNWMAYSTNGWALNGTYWQRTLTNAVGTVGPRVMTLSIRNETASTQTNADWGFMVTPN